METVDQTFGMQIGCFSIIPSVAPNYGNIGLHPSNCVQNCGGIASKTGGHNGPFGVFQDEPYNL